MIDVKLLVRATFVGIVLQLAMAVLVHFIPWIALEAYIFAGMCISGVAGLFYARDLNKGWAIGAIGGAIAGAICALTGIWLSVVLRDTTPNLIPFVLFASTLSGAVGGPFGQMAANMREIREAALGRRPPRGRNR